MDNAILVGLSRQMVLRREMEIIANNIANMDTTGFKVESMMQKTEPGAPAVTQGGPKPVKFVAADGVARNFGQGGLTLTGAPLDMAIEGKVVTHSGNRVFFQFADNEADKLTFFNARDFLPYGHAEHSMRDWAAQFEQMTRREAGLVLKDSSAVTLKLH